MVYQFIRKMKIRTKENSLETGNEILRFFKFEIVGNI